MSGSYLGIVVTESHVGDIQHAKLWTYVSIMLALCTAEKEHAWGATQCSCGWDGPLSCAMSAAQLLGGA